MDWLIYLIIIGVISSVINKKKHQEPNHPQPRRSEGFEPETKEETRYKIERYEFEVEREPRERELDVNFKKETVGFGDEDNSLLNSEIGNDQIGNDQIGGEATSSERKPLIIEEEELDIGKLDKNKVIQGMIWSEVFGAPRSKNPHKTYRNNQR